MLSQSGTKRTGTDDAALHAAAVERGRGGAERGEAGSAVATARTAAIDAGARECCNMTVIIVQGSTIKMAQSASFGPVDVRVFVLLSPGVIDVSITI